MFYGYYRTLLFAHPSLFVQISLRLYVTNAPFHNEEGNVFVSGLFVSGLSLRIPSLISDMKLLGSLFVNEILLKSGFDFHPLLLKI